MKHHFLLTLIFLLTFSLTLASFSTTHFIARADSNNPAWQLSVGGLVNNPSNFTLSDLKAMPPTTVSAALICVGPPETTLEDGSWTGVKLSTLLNAAGGIQPGAIKVAFNASDGFTTDLTIALAENDNVILAYAKDGAPLPEVLRLVVPEHWGYKWISQVTNIELANYDFTGKYESQGYSDEAIVAQYESPIISITSPPMQTTSPAPSASPMTTPSPSIPPIANSTSRQSSSEQQSNVTPQNFNPAVGMAGISIVIIIIVVALIAVRKRK
jgi:DMSO/TMAO reductase YedYZ molybdopterin-dependent catalytic subunit